MKTLLIIFFVFLFLLVLYFLSLSYTGSFTETQKSLDAAKNRWHLIGKVEIIDGRIVSVNQTVS